jgi:hypothetical protein
VVVDRNRVTGGGVTAGIDFGLVLLAIWRGDEVAKVTQLAMEYDPEPPLDAGSPEAAGPVLTALALCQIEARGATEPRGCDDSHDLRRCGGGTVPDGSCVL